MLKYTGLKLRRRVWREGKEIGLSIRLWAKRKPSPNPPMVAMHSLYKIDM